MLVTHIAVFFQSFADDSPQLGRYLGIQVLRRRLRAVEDGVKNLYRSLATKWQGPGGHLVEDDAKAEQIATRIERLAERLLRRHICDSAYRGAGPGKFALDGGAGLLSCLRRLRLQLHFGQTKIQDLGVTALGHEDVCRLDVAEVAAFGVGGIERS